MVLDPQELDTKQVFAIDQFLMQGGTVLLSASPIDVSVDRSIVARPVKSGLEDWLSGYGLSYGKGLVLDQQSGALPIPIERNVGGLNVQEIELAKYPYIVDVRDRGLSTTNPITASLGQIDVPWAAPILLDKQHEADRKVTTLLRSSDLSWISESPNLVPDYQSYPGEGFAVNQPAGPQTLAVMVEGAFDSAFKGKPSPLLASNAGQPPAEQKDQPAFDRVIQHSSGSSRLVLLGSSAMLSDQAIRLIGGALGTDYTKPGEFVENLVDWSLEDQGLLSIRSREHFARTLAPLSRTVQSFWEYFNYAVVLGGLGVIWIMNRRRRRMAGLRQLKLLEQL
jgi:ABC-2 type transport system permease protein